MNLRETLGRRLLLLDGATGTQLQARGLGSGQTPELWNIERREDMIAIHHSYYAAGADLVLSNTFGVNRLKLRNCHTPWTNWWPPPWKISVLPGTKRATAG